MGVIQEKGVGAIKKMFIDDIETIENLPLARTPIPEGDCQHGRSRPRLSRYGFSSTGKWAHLALASQPLGALAMAIIVQKAAQA